MLKFINTLITALFIAMLLGVAGLLVGSMLPIPGNIEIKIVKSGSMEPAIPTGSLVIVKPAASYAVGDVITFGADTASEIPTTHRIVAVEGAGSERIFITKGDANEEIDQESVAAREVIGKVLVSVPGAGFVLDFARQPLGFALLIGLPAGLIILEEMLAIGKEVRAALRRRRGDDDTPKGGGSSVDDDGAPLRLFYGRRRMMDEIFVPMYMKPGFMHAEWWHKQFRMHKDTYGTSTAVVMGLVFVSSMMAGGAGGTIAYFSDIERSIGNVFRAGTWEPPVEIDALMFSAVLGATTEDILPPEEKVAEEEPEGDIMDEIVEEGTSPEGGGGGGSGSGGGSDIPADPSESLETEAPTNSEASPPSEDEMPPEEVVEDAETSTDTESQESQEEEGTPASEESEIEEAPEEGSPAETSTPEVI